jgi:hypothetical protein
VTNVDKRLWVEGIGKGPRSASEVVALEYIEGKRRRSTEEGKLETKERMIQPSRIERLFTRS